MAREYKKISVFLDTNIMQSFISMGSGKKSFVFLSSLGIPRTYYDLVRFISENGLQDHVEICISEVVLAEIRQHMVKCFQGFCDIAKADIDTYRKVGGDIFEITYEPKLSKEEYPAVVDEMIKEFLDNPRNMCRYIPIPADENMVNILLEKAIKGIKPFQLQKIEGKQYSDGGFKDAMIAETIFSHGANTQRICMLVSDDGDFGAQFEPTLSDKSKFVKCASIDQAIGFLKKYYETDVEDRLHREFKENVYWHEFLLTDVGQIYDKSVTDVIVESVEQYEEALYIIKIRFVVNEVHYIFSVFFDSVANDILDYVYQVVND